jgi:hypothetical protein
MDVGEQASSKREVSRLRHVQPGVIQHIELYLLAAGMPAAPAWCPLRVLDNLN